MQRPPKLLIAVTLLVLASLSAPRLARAQWIEQLVGTWVFWVYGNCPVYGCLDGPRLCAQVDSNAGTTWCYQH